MFLRRMSQKGYSKLFENATEAEKRLASLQVKLEVVKRAKIKERIAELTEENASLARKVDEAKANLVKQETLHGKKQYPIPGTLSLSSVVENNISAKAPEPVVEQKAAKEVKEKTEAKKTKGKPATAEVDSIIDVRKLDFRIGKIIEINKHPDADSLYVEKIDCGESNPRTVVSGLVNHVPIEEMRDRIVMVLCNLKPVKMRGVTSEAMVMCASSPEKVEVLVPPSSAVPGDLVSCNGYPREPEAQLNPKKKIFETCAPDLKTNNEKVACYKDKPLVIPGKGPVVASTLCGVSVK